MAQSITSNHIKVTGAFERYRDFIYVSDAVKALILGLKDETNSQIYNVGSGVKTSVRELINLILDINEKDKAKFKITNVGAHEGDTFGSLANINKISKLNFKANVKLKDGLKLMYDYAKKELL